MPRACAVVNCSSSATKLYKWKKEQCDRHGVPKGQRERCNCEPPFTLYPFPTDDPPLRELWIQQINRKTYGTNRRWEPNCQSRVCSLHFALGVPFPTLNLGYKAKAVKERTLLRHCYPLRKEPLRKRKVADPPRKVADPPQQQVPLEQGVESVAEVVVVKACSLRKEPLRKRKVADLPQQQVPLEQGVESVAEVVVVEAGSLETSGSAAPLEVDVGDVPLSVNKEEEEFIQHADHSYTRLPSALKEMHTAACQTDTSPDDITSLKKKIEYYENILKKHCRLCKSPLFWYCLKCKCAWSPAQNCLMEDCLHISSVRKEPLLLNEAGLPSRKPLLPQKNALSVPKTCAGTPTAILLLPSPSAVSTAEVSALPSSSAISAAGGCAVSTAKVSTLLSSSMSAAGNCATSAAKTVILPACSGISTANTVTLPAVCATSTAKVSSLPVGCVNSTAKVSTLSSTCGIPTAGGGVISTAKISTVSSNSAIPTAGGGAISTAKVSTVSSNSSISTAGGCATSTSKKVILLASSAISTARVSPLAAGCATSTAKVSTLTSGCNSVAGSTAKTVILLTDCVTSTAKVSTVPSDSAVCTSAACSTFTAKTVTPPSNSAISTAKVSLTAAGAVMSTGKKILILPVGSGTSTGIAPSVPVACGSSTAGVHSPLQKAAMHRSSHKNGIVKSPRAKKEAKKAPRQKAQKDGGGPFICPICGTEFARSHRLKVHIQFTHKGQAEHMCHHCGETFASGSHLISHLRQDHSAEAPYICEQCGVAITTKKSYRRHVLIHTGERPFPCKMCPKRFISTAALNLHLRQHTGEKPYQCEDCGKNFTTSAHFRTHRRIHTGEKPYKCRECGKAFPSYYRLTMHMRSHTGEKPFLCQACGGAFSQKSNLNSHKCAAHFDNSDFPASALLSVKRKNTSRGKKNSS